MSTRDAVVREGLLGRRRFLQSVAATAALGAVPRGWANVLPVSPSARPRLPHGVQSGDVSADRAVVWAAADRPSRMHVEYATNEHFRGSKRVVGPPALAVTGLTAKLVLTDLPAAERVFYRVTMQSLRDLKAVSRPVVGSLVTPATDTRDVSFTWSGDTVGQGWGINPDWGGLRIYDTMRRVQPDFFIHCGDLIYADGPLESERRLPDGSTWRNVVTEAKSKVAETLDEFRGNYAYNLLDENVRRFNADVPSYVLWDDHEVTDNWYWERRLDGRYREKSAALLAARANRALREWTPLSRHPDDPTRLYRAFSRGPLLDVFRLDLRSYRGPNNANDQEKLQDDCRILGESQLDWLKQSLLGSKATWKVIASDMPIGLIVHHDWSRRWGSEAIAQGDGPPRGRELEIADLLAFIARHDIRNVVWLTADVHYCATHLYSPSRARFSSFKAFHEFVSGPLHAGGFGPNQLDDTFGPQVLFSKHPAQPNAPPTSGGLYFGHVFIEGSTGVMTVSHLNVAGETLASHELAPER